MITYYDTEDLKDTIEKFINGNVTIASKNMQEIADLWQQLEFLDELDNFWEKTKMEMLSYYFRQI